MIRVSRNCSPSLPATICNEFAIEAYAPPAFASSQGEPNLVIQSKLAVATWSAKASSIAVLVASLLFIPFGYTQNHPLDAAAQYEAKVLVYSQAWTKQQVEPVYAKFRSWTEQYLARRASNTAFQSARSSLLSEGIAFARQRRIAIRELIRSDPEQAIALSVSASIRQLLPFEVLRELEARVSGSGDFSVIAALPAKGGPTVEAVQRRVGLNGQNYRAYVYGRRSNQTTKIGIPLHGVAIDGVLALSESSIRELETGEVLEPTKQRVDLTSTPQAPTSGQLVLGEVGETVYRFRSREQLLAAEAKLEDAEAGIGPNPKRPTSTVLCLDPKPQQREGEGAPNGWTTGNKKVLIIRVDFPDLPGDPTYGSEVYTAGYVQNLADTQVAPHYLASSYGLTSLTNTVTTQLYRLPQAASNYCTRSDESPTLYQLHVDAKALASADYTLGTYDRIAVLFSWLGNIPGSLWLFGGRGEVGGANIWLNGNFNLYIVAHELGHTYGLWHANRWQVTDGNPISASGHSAEYGDNFDTMGSGSPPTTADFNPYYKHILGWISPSQIQTITETGTYRINRFDDASSTGTLALKVAKDGERSYWIACRRSFTTNTSMQHGVYVIWGYNTLTGTSLSDLLDMTTPGDDTQDAALAIGATFTDLSAGVSFLPVSEGGIEPNQYIDVAVTLSDYTITTSSLPTAGGTTTGDGTFPGPSLRTVTATAMGGHTFVSWSENGAVVSTSAGYTFTLNNNRHLVAHFSIGPTPTPIPGQTQALNISTRMRVDSGNNVLIGGFIITGNAPKDVIVRGIGPSLAALGISGFLSDPTLELRAASGALIQTNDDWQGDLAQAAQITAGGLALQHPKESGIAVRLYPGSYTGILAGKNQTTGIGLVEAYDTGQTADSYLANISTRGFVVTGDNVMIGGFILGGANNTRVAARGIGPSLARFGLSPVLADPTLELHDGNGATVVSNDDWQDDPASASQLTFLGLAPSDTTESGIFQSLPPGAFTAILAGKGGGTGIGLVEIYNVH
jgi:hypothetical protein